MVTTVNHTDKAKFQFQALPAPTIVSANPSNGQRRFQGVAYTGDVIENHWCWGNVIFDLSTIAIPSKSICALVNHDGDKIVGPIDDVTIDNSTGIKVSGKLVDAEGFYGKYIADGSDNGVPWQMSVCIEPGSIEEIMPGTDIVVNGRSLSGPLTVFRNSNISEVSFTPTGWDDGTSAAAMSKSGSQQPTTGESDMELKELQAQIAKMEAEKSENAAKLAELTTKFSQVSASYEALQSEKRVSDVKNLFASIGMEYTEESAKDYLSMDAAAFAVVSKSLLSFAKSAQNTTESTATKLPALLFSHQATKGAEKGEENKGTEDALVADARKRAEKFAKQSQR